MTLPSRYSRPRERKHIHLRLTYDMWQNLAFDKNLRGSVPEKIRMILLERYPSREGEMKE
jgi:hypothetical protein